MSLIHQTFNAPLDGIVKLDKIRGDIRAGAALRYLFSYILRQPEESIKAILESEKVNEENPHSEV